MIFRVRQIGLGVLIGAMFASPHVTWAQDAMEAASLYDRGVRAYFSSSPNEAEALLTQAITLAAEDPRLFYFRGLTRLRSGRVEEARADMRAGAALEARQSNRYAVGKALERVQGGQRLMLEQFRRDGLAGAAQVRAQLQRQRDEQIRVHDRAVLRDPVVIPLDALLGPGEPRALSPSERAAYAPVSPARPAGKSVPPLAAPDDPFRDDAQPAKAAPQASGKATSGSPAPASARAQKAEPKAPAAAPPKAKKAEEEDPFGGFST